MKKFILILTLIAVLVLAAGCGNDATPPNGNGGEKTIKIGLTLMDYNFTFFQDMLAMAKMTAEDMDIELIDFDGGGNPAQQLSQVEDMIAMGVDAIFLNPVDTAAIVPAVQAANDAGIPVITIDVRAAGGDVLSHVASDNVEIGRMAARYVVELLTEKNGAPEGTVVIVGYPQITSMRDRVEGFKEVMESEAGITLVQRDPIKLNVADSLNVAEDILNEYSPGSIDVIFGANSQTSLGILSAVESANRTDVAIVGVDEDPDLISAMQRKSQFMAAIVQSPTDMGKLGVEFAVKAANGENTPKEVATEIELVNQDNVEDYVNKMKDLLTSLEPYKN